MPPDLTEPDAPVPDPFDSPRPVRSTDDVDLATYDLDPGLAGTAPDVLFVHATGFCAGVWGPLAHHLVDVRRAALDVRGHGRSAVDDAWLERVGMDWHGTAADVLATVDALGLDAPVGVGHSMGGASLLLAELARPGTFRAIWCFEPIVFPPELVASGGEGNPLVEGARRRRRTFASAAEAEANYARKPPLDALAPAALAAYVRHGFAEAADGTVTLRCRPEVEAATFAMGGRHGAWARLGSVACPVVVVRGRAGGPGPAALAPGIVERLGDGRLEEHPELGHFGPLEDPAGMAASVRRLLDAV